MNFVVTTAQMKKAEENSGNKGELMKNAGKACFDAISGFIGGVKGKNFVVICGRGNNGGDGLEIVSEIIGAGGTAVALYAVDFPSGDTARKCFSEYEDSLPVALYTHKEEIAKSVLKGADVIVDCVFGTGFHGELEEKLSDLFRFVNNECGALKFSVDVPSGVNADSGEICGNAFMPHVTYALGAIKRGMLSHPCFEACGNIVLLDIGIAPECYTEYEAVLTDESILEKQPPRPKNSNKGTFGKLLNISGCGEFPGAALLSSKAAMRAGTGLVTLATPKRVINAVAAGIPETVYLPLDQDIDAIMDKSAAETLREPLENADACAIGCGIGNNINTRFVTEFVLANGDCPLILDADGINSICDNINVLKDNRHPIVLTPHPGEFMRMTGLSVEQIQHNRLQLAKTFAKESGCVLLLKGVNTVIASPDGRAFVNTTGNSALAKGGSGDVLTGIIAGLLAQGADPFDAAVLGAYLHGKCADELVKKASPAGIIPGDIVEFLPFVMR